MAREESTREDLLREATALAERIELALYDSAATPSNTQPTLRRVVAGFRRDGALSVFFGDDVVYQFNAAGELRRAYSEGLLLKAMRGRLASLQRVRTPRETQLVRQDLTYAEQSAFLAQMTRHLSELKSALDNCRFETVGQVPPDADVLARLQGWLRTQDEFQIAARPNVGR